MEELANQAVEFLSSSVVKIGEKAVEQVGERLPKAAGRLWKAIMGRFKGKPAAEEAVTDLVSKPADQLGKAAMTNQLKKLLEAEPTFQAELESLLAEARREAGVTIVNTGSGAVATGGSVATGEGGVAVQGDVHGNITAGGTEKKTGVGRWCQRPDRQSAAFRPGSGLRRPSHDNPGGGE